MTAFVANANMLTLSDLTSELEGVLDNAMVTVALREEDGDEMVGAGWPTWPQIMEAVDGSPGSYRIVFDADVPWIANRTYEALISVADVAEFRYRFRAKIRLIQA